ncbi:MAG: preprotein translocase subunit YajC [Actinomycetota bacterium]|nr:preprotein translocase subunit YajC [Actinomycetota bacterium]
MEAILPLIAMFGLMWLLLIRPQQRRVRQHQAVVAAIQAGDEVITAGGIHGTVTDVEDDTVLIEISPDVIVRVLTGAISQRLTPPEDLDAEDELDDDADEGDGEDEGEKPVDPTESHPTSEKGTKPGRVEAIGEDQP